MMYSVVPCGETHLVQSRSGFNICAVLRRNSGLFCFLWLSLAGLVAEAQITRGSLSGNVRDQNGAVVPNVTVIEINPDNKEAQTTVTNGQGEFIFPALLTGRYELKVAAPGFKRVTVQNVVVEVATPARVTIALEVGALDDEVTIAGGQESVNTTSPELTRVVERRQVQDLPLPSRSPLDLALLQAGVTTPLGNYLYYAHVSGLRGSSTNVTQDGINVMNNVGKGQSFGTVTAPSVEATAEFSISVGTISSSSGRGVGQVKIVTSSGANEFHGGVFEFHRNAVLNANDFISNSFGTPRSFQIQNRFGGTASGPVWLPQQVFGPASYDGRKRSFWFFSYEGYREPFSANRTRTVLTPEARQGIYRYFDTGGQLRSVNLYQIGNVNAANPVTQALLAQTPLPNSNFTGDGLNVAGYTFSQKVLNKSTRMSGRYDQVLGRHKLEVILHRMNNYYSRDVFNGGDTPFPGGISAYIQANSTVPVVAFHSTFGSHLTNEFRSGWQDAPSGFLPEKLQTQPFTIAFASVTRPVNDLTTTTTKRRVQHFQDHVAWVRNSHTLRMGTEVQSIYWADSWDGGVRPVIQLGANPANPDGILFSTLLGLPANANGFAILNRARNIYFDLTGNLAYANQTFNVTSPTSGFVPGAPTTAPLRQRELNLYAQDQWRVRRNLTINAGLRWEFIGVPRVMNGLTLQPVNGVDGLYGVSGRGNLFNPGVLKGSSPTYYDFAGEDKGRPLYHNDWNNFAPSIGFAYALNFQQKPLKWLFGGEGKSAIRGGYAISYLRDGLAVGIGALLNNPGLTTTIYNNALTGVVTAGGVKITPPIFKTPITDVENFQNNPYTINAAYDQNLRTPYVQQWSFGIEREVTHGTTVEARYVGNHAVKLYRAFDVNEINIFENGFLQEYQNAQQNLQINQGSSFAPGAPGTVPLPIFSKLFQGLSAFSGFSNSNFINQLYLGNVGFLASTLATSPVYAFNRTQLPPNFFRANPNANYALVFGGGSASNYHALQLELRRRFDRGLSVQANYTFSKAITDQEGNGGFNYEAYRTLRNLRLDRHRADYDVTHNLVGNFIFELPVGTGRRFWHGGPRIVRKIIEGWQTQGIVTWHSGFPIMAYSGRATFNGYTTNNPAQLLGMSFAEFKRNIGIYRRPEGIFFFNPDYLNITNASDGSLQTATLKNGILGAPPPGQFGNFPRNALNAPMFFQADLGVTKRTRIGEHVNVELRGELFNAFNNVTFGSGSLQFDSFRFSQVFGAFPARIGQVSMRVNW